MSQGMGPLDCQVGMYSRYCHRYGDVFVVSTWPGSENSVTMMDNGNGFKLQGNGGVSLASKDVDGPDPNMYWQVNVMY